jgi:hypothetical protein
MPVTRSSDWPKISREVKSVKLGLRSMLISTFSFPCISGFWGSARRLSICPRVHRTIELGWNGKKKSQNVMGEYDNKGLQYAKEVRFPVHMTFTKTYFNFNNLKGVTKHDPFSCVPDVFTKSDGAMPCLVFKYVEITSRISDCTQQLNGESQERSQKCE